MITLTEIGTAPIYGDAILVQYGSAVGSVQYWYNGTAWIEAQQKVQYVAPLFQLYDLDGNPLNDPSIYPSSTFAGNSIFTYDVDPYAGIDTELQLRPALDQFGNFVFNNTLVTDTYTYVYNATVTAIPGYAYYRNNDPVGFEFNNAWYKSPQPSRQYIVNDFTILQTSSSFTIDQVPDPNPGLFPSIYVYLISDGYSTTLVNGTDYTVSKNIVTLSTPAIQGQRVLVRSWNRSYRINNLGYYELPLNLTANPNNLQIEIVSQDQMQAQFSGIIGNQPGFQGNPFGNNNWRDTPRILGLGLNILQHKAPLIKPMILSSGNVTVGINTVQSKTDPLLAMQYTQREYLRFYNRLISSLLNLWANGYGLNESPTQWLLTAFRQINLDFIKYLSTC